MKPLMTIPPAQAEALYDAREEPPDARFLSLPWLDDDALEDPASIKRQAAQVRTAAVGSKAQHWPSSSNNSR